MSDERVRLFVALELPVDVRDALRAWVGGVGVGGLRLLDAEQLHVTLCFLGWQTASDVGAVAAACQGLAPGKPPHLSVDGGAWLPPRRPRVLAVRLDDHAGRLTALQADLSERLQSGGWYEPERRAYLPHVTVARAAKHAVLSARGLPDTPELSFTGAQLTLFRSRPALSGASYEALRRVSLL